MHQEVTVKHVDICLVSLNNTKWVFVTKLISRPIIFYDECHWPKDGRQCRALSQWVRNKGRGYTLRSIKFCQTIKIVSVLLQTLPSTTTLHTESSIYSSMFVLWNSVLPQTVAGFGALVAKAGQARPAKYCMDRPHFGVKLICYNSWRKIWLHLKKKLTVLYRLGRKIVDNYYLHRQLQ